MKRKYWNRETIGLWVAWVAIIIPMVVVLVYWGYAEPAELQRYQGYVPEYGDSLRHDGDRLQTIENYTPKYGDYYESTGDGNLQHYDGYTPHYGHELRREGGRMQEYRGYVQEEGDWYE